MKEQRVRRGIRWLLFILSTVFIMMPLSAEMVARMPQVLRPFFITITAGRLYVVEDSSKVHIFNMDPKGVAFVKTFGQEGEGPGEFDFIHQIRVRKDHLEIPTLGKFARFSLDGLFIDEIKLPIRVFKNGIYQMGENYLARDYSFDNKESTTSIRLYNKDFKLISEIGVRMEPGGINKLNLVANYYSARVSDDKIYVADSGKETIVTVYDPNGIKQKEIRLPLEPVKMTAALKEIIIKPLKENKQMKSRWEDFEKRLYFPDHTPGLDYFEVVDGRFVTRTYNYRENSVEFVIFDLQGRELKRLFLPNTGRLSNGVLFCFSQGRFFCLRENIDAEVWELHSEKAW
jgi:hypothetical protein